MSTDVTIRHKDVALLELLDRVLEKGVVVAGDITISVADIDLIYVGLRLLLCSVEKMQEMKSAPSFPRTDLALWGEEDLMR